MSSPDPMTVFLRGLKGFVRSLPSEEERDEVLRTLRGTRDLLDEVQRLLQDLPTLESSQELSHAMTRLEVIAAEARSNPGVSRMLRLRKSGTAGGKRPKEDSDPAARVRSLWESVRTLEKSEIARSLERSGEPVRVLKAFAGNLGLRVRSSERRADLIQRIATHIENERNYRLLRGETPEAASRLPKARAS